MSEGLHPAAVPRVRAGAPSRATLNGRGVLVSLGSHLPLAAFAVLMIFPLVWLVSTSLKDPGEQFAFPPRLIPWPLYFQNYVDLF